MTDKPMRHATPIQAQLVHATGLRPHDPSPNWALLSRLPAGTDPVRFAAAVEAILHENHAFTEIFEPTDDGGVVVTPSPVRAPVEVVNYPDLAAVQAEVARLGDSVFDPSCAPAYRAEIGIVGTDGYFLFAGSHVLSDGFGFYHLIADFAARYADPGYRSPDPSSPAETIEPYTRSRADAVHHFQQVFAGLDSLQIDGWDRRDSRGRFPGGISRRPLPFDDYRDVKEVARTLGVRRYAVLLSVLAVAAGCLAETDTVVVSTPMSNRRSGPRSASTRGVRVNALPVRFDLGAAVDFADLCRSAESQIAALVEFEQHAFSEFSRHVIAGESMAATQPSVAFTVYPRPLAVVADDVRGEPINVDRRYLQYPLTVDVEVGDREATLIVERADHLPGCDIAELYLHILRQVIDRGGHLSLGEISWATTGLAARVPIETEFEPRTLDAEFAAAVAQHPDAVAVVTDDERVTCRELATMSDAIAAWVHEHVPERLVGVAMAPSIRWLATMLALFRANKVYVPIDATAAPARLAQIVAECRGLPVLTEHGAAPLDGMRTIELPSEPNAAAPAAPSSPLPSPRLDDPAYLIFTSGTTGTPKGVQISHRSAVRFFDGLREATGRKAGRWLQFHSISFDISIVESLGALFDGAAVCIPSTPVRRDPGRIVDFVRRHGISVISQTPSAFAMLSPGLRALDCVRDVLLCGERLEYAPLREFVTARPDVTVWNCYGITETTMYHTAFPVPDDPARFPAESVIGRPFADMGMAVVDRQLRVLPRGVAGQLVVHGAGLMQGYLHGDELTAARIVSLDGVATYLTGDRGHLDTDGRFVVAGRSDNQVKIRGHRCELGEIDHALYTTGAVDSACAMLVGAGLTAELVCVVVLAGDHTVADVRHRVRELLPRYFEPDRVVAVEALPVDSNGKVDTEALRQVAAEAPAPAGDGAAGDRSDVGTVVTEVWGEVLGTSQFDGATRFFDAGGTSAMVLQVGQRLRARLGVTDLEVIDLFEHCTPDALTRFLADKV